MDKPMGEREMPEERLRFHLRKKSKYASHLRAQQDALWSVTLSLGVFEHELNTHSSCNPQAESSIK